MISEQKIISKNKKNIKNKILKGWDNLNYTLVPQITEKSSNHKLREEPSKIIFNKKSKVQNTLLESHLMMIIWHISLHLIKSE